jgi:hypothetical protein
MKKKPKDPSWLDNEPFVPITYEMMDSRAYKQLSKAGIKILIFTMRKVKIKNPIDRFKYQFTFTYPEARKYGLWDSFFARGINQLHDLGFLDIVIKGGRRGESKFCTYYRLSQRWKKYGTPEFKRLHKGYAISVHGDYLDA